MTQKIRIYSLSVSCCKDIFDRNLFTITGFKENDDAKKFDIELANIDALSLHDNGVTIISCADEYFISRNDYKEIIIVWVKKEESL